MPSGRGSGHSIGGHSHHSHSSGHFGGSRSSAGSRSYRPTMRWRPHTMVFWGRPVYLGTGRACAFSALGILIVFALFIAVGTGMGWYFIGKDVSTHRGYYELYHRMALNAVENGAYQTWGTIYDYEPYADSGKYCIYYRFKTTDGPTVEDFSYVEGFSYYVYDYSIIDLVDVEDGLLLAIDVTNDKITTATDSVPLDYKDTTLKDDAQYMDNLNMRNVVRAICCVSIAVGVLMIVGAVLVPLTAQRATKEQLAESNPTGGSANTDNQTAATNSWRCGYCNTMNDNSKNACDGCGAKRQK